MSGEPDTLPDGILAEVTIQTHARKNTPGQALDAWGIIDRDEFIVLCSKHKAVWDEVGYTGEPVMLTERELESVRHAPGYEPEEVLVALARFRLTGKVEPICSE
jgi:hypothetical protein